MGDNEVVGEEETFLKYDFQTVRKHLLENVCGVNFRKKNGDIRKMKCTLMSSHIPENQIPKPGTEQAEEKDFIRAWDIEIKDWRSFRLDSINGFWIKVQPRVQENKSK